MTPLVKHLRKIERHNNGLDCFSDKYRFPIVLADGSHSHVTRNGGTSICGSPTYTLPIGAFPLVCWEPAFAPWLPGGDIVQGHDSERGPTHPCPHCIQVRGRKGQTAWVYVDGEFIGSSQLGGEE